MIKPRFIADYLKHRLSATAKAPERSLFVRGLIKDIIYDADTKPVYAEIEQLRRQLLADGRCVEVLDLGAGSRVSKRKTRRIGRIAKHNLKPAKLAQLLYRLVAAFSPDTLVELGTCLGITTVYLAKAIPEGKVITIEGCPAIAQVARETFRKAMQENIIIRNDNFDAVMPGIFKETKTDFVFIDGNHRKEATLNYFRHYLSHAGENSIMVFDDIYWSEGMKEAWKEICDHEKVTVSIDLFWIGLVFFRDHPKQHLIIKI